MSPYGTRWGRETLGGCATTAAPIFLMAEFLIKAIDATHPDPVKNERGCYKRGDVVAVKPDGWPWGAREGFPTFVIVKVPGLDPAAVEHLLHQHEDTTDPENPKVFKRRLWGFHLDHAALPTQVKKSLRDTGSVTVTLPQIKNFVKHKLSQQTL